MPIYLRHPKHGSKVAISDLEAKADAVHGWVEYDPLKAVQPVAKVEAEPAAPAVAVEAVSDEPAVNALAAPRKPGRPRKTEG